MTVKSCTTAKKTAYMYILADQRPTFVAIAVETILKGTLSKLSFRKLRQLWLRRDVGHAEKIECCKRISEGAAAWARTSKQRAGGEAQNNDEVVHHRNTPVPHSTPRARR